MTIRMNGMHAGMYPGYGILFQILIILLVVFIVWWVLRGKNGNESAVDIVNKRYARGEIKQREYVKLKRDIGITGKKLKK